MADKTLTVTEAADRLQVTTRAVQKWIAAGSFPNAYKLNPDLSNSPYRIPESDVRALEAKRTA